MSQIENNESIAVPEKSNGFLGVFKPRQDTEEKIAKLESRLEKMDNLEKELKEANERIQWLEMKHEKRIEGLERSAEIRGKIMDSVCNECTKLSDFQTSTESCLNTLFQSLGQIEKRQERAEAKNNEIFDKIDNTILDHQQETEMIQCEVDDLSSIQQRMEYRIGELRLKITHVCQEIENVTKNVNEVTGLVGQVYFKNKNYDEKIRMVMERMDEHEMVMKKYKADISATKEQLATPQRECQFCDSLAEIKFDRYDCCVSCYMQHQ
jgi:vacuolar-type H+-ATPase subunit I/STV1